MGQIHTDTNKADGQFWATKGWEGRFLDMEAEEGRRGGGGGGGGGKREGRQRERWEQGRE